METSEEEFIVPEKELAFMAASNVNDLIATASAEENVVSQVITENEQSKADNTMRQNLSLQEDPSSEGM